MTADALAERLLQTFVGELEDQLAALDADLVALESHAGRDPERLASVFRVFHTLKGAARAAGVARVESACHGLESLLADVRDGRRTLGGAEFALLFTAVDALADAGRRLRDRRSLEGGPLVELERELAGAAVTRLASSNESWSPPRSPAQSSPSSSSPRSARAREEAPAASAAPAVRASDDAPEPPRADVAPESAGGTASLVRVAAEKLDELVNAAGEVTVQVARAERQPDALAALAADASRWAFELRRVLPRLRQALADDARREAPAPDAVDAVDAVEPRRARPPRHARDPRGGERLAAEVDTIEARARELAASLARVATAARDDAGALGRASGALGEQVRRLRLRPFGEAAEALPRVARDVAAAAGKEIELRVEGGDVEADRAVLDGVREALLHLVRNAVDHGIEAPEERARAGKPARGTVVVAAALRAGGLRITVRDDGRGLDTAAIREQLARRGQPAPEDERALAHVLFEGGFSTRQEATRFSGRGVGLDVVRAAMRRVRGTVAVDWRAGEGSTFTLDAPLSLATQRALVLDVGGQALAVPVEAVLRLERTPAEVAVGTDGRRYLPTADGPVPIAALARLLGPPLADPAGAAPPLVVVGAAERRVALAVDDVLGDAELVVRPVSWHGAPPLPTVAGAALLGDGRVALVLDAPALVTLGRRPGLASQAPAPAAPAPARRPVVLVVDDSITTRTLEQSVLEAAGLDVVTAVDGEDGWRVLQERGADLVLSDVEMPRMDGFTLCETIRASRRFAQLPVVLVTSLESPEHRARGREAGADAYVVKSSFDQEALLATVRDLLGREGAA